MALPAWFRAPPFLQLRVAAAAVAFPAAEMLGPQVALVLRVATEVALAARKCRGGQQAALEVALTTPLLETCRRRRPVRLVATAATAGHAVCLTTIVTIILVVLAGPAVAGLALMRYSLVVVVAVATRAAEGEAANALMVTLLAAVAAAAL